MEELKKGMSQAIELALAAINFGPDGLVPAIAQQHDTGEVLMLAWMNRDAVRTSLREGRACYWSRSRGALWRKGETSGQVQRLREMRLDCDGDALLLLVDQQGVACHTGRRSCFFRGWRDAGWEVLAEPLVAPETLYPEAGAGRASDAPHPAALPAPAVQSPACGECLGGGRMGRRRDPVAGG
jgi:phosphoribosyl-AMP cyclohydrolase